MAAARYAAPRATRYRKAIDKTAGLDEDIMCLRARNLSYRSIAEALGHFRNVELSEHQVAYAAGMLGETPDQSKVRSGGTP